jgi:hypothetical protein
MTPVRPCELLERRLERRVRSPPIVPRAGSLSHDGRLDVGTSAPSWGHPSLPTGGGIEGEIAVLGIPNQDTLAFE